MRKQQHMIEAEVREIMVVYDVSQITFSKNGEQPLQLHHVANEGYHIGEEACV
jgi:hypothetical protein